jgi:hypothetical protein
MRGRREAVRVTGSDDETLEALMKQTGMTRAELLRRLARTDENRRKET